MYIYFDGSHIRATEYYCHTFIMMHEVKAPVSIEKWSFNIRFAYARLRQVVYQLDIKTA